MLPIDPQKYSRLLPEQLFNVTNYQALVTKLQFHPNLFAILKKIFHELTETAVPDVVKIKKQPKEPPRGFLYSVIKLITGNSQQGLSYSVVKLIAANNEEVFYLLTNLYLGLPGTGGRVKAAIRIIPYEDHYEICANEPVAIKIYHVHNFDLSPDTLAWQDHYNYYGKVFATQRRSTPRKHPITEEFLAKTYAIMPCFPGIELYDFHRNYLKFSAENVQSEPKCNLAERLQICLAIATAIKKKFHDQGKIHPDIKLANFMLSHPSLQEPFTVWPIDIDGLYTIGQPVPFRFIASFEYLPPDWYAQIAPTYLSGSYEDLLGTPASNVYNLAVLFAEIMGWEDINLARREARRFIYKDKEYKEDPHMVVAKFAAKIFLDVRRLQTEPSFRGKYSQDSPQVVESLIKLISTMANYESVHRPSMEKVIESLQNLYDQAKPTCFPSCSYLDSPAPTAEKLRVYPSHIIQG